MKRRQTGFTLIELMIVVAIIGVLSSLAVFAYQQSISKTRASTEVNGVFAEFQIRQEEFHAENGRYLSTGVSETERFPPGAPIGDGAAAIEVRPLIPADPGTGTAPADNWARLRMNPKSTALRCSYVSIAGGSGDSFGAEAISFGGPPPPDANWFYILAECDVDGEGAPNTLYFSRSDISGLAVRNDGQ